MLTDIFKMRYSPGPNCPIMYFYFNIPSKSAQLTDFFKTLDFPSYNCPIMYFFLKIPSKTTKVFT